MKRERGEKEREGEDPRDGEGKNEYCESRGVPLSPLLIPKALCSGLTEPIVASASPERTAENSSSISAHRVRSRGGLGEGERERRGTKAHRKGGGRRRRRGHCEI